MTSNSPTGQPSNPSPSQEATIGLSTVGALSASVASGVLRCPGCHHPLQRSQDKPAEAVCPLCSSTFQVRDEEPPQLNGEEGRLGKFQLLEKRGAGAFGVVWKARDLELDRVVALKIPHPGVASSPRDLERFQREARAAAQLRHPGIVSVHEVALVGGHPAIVSDFIDGLTLRELIALHRLTYRDTAELTAQVAEALDYAHSKGLVHRDIKPANIMIELVPSGTREPAHLSADGSGPRPLLMDFGLALREEAEITLTVEGQIVGTPAYMSPEQAAGGGHQVDRRSDVFSLGVVLYELLTGELPFRGSHTIMLQQVLHEEPRPPRQINDKVPRDLETICLKAMEKSPARRYGTARELADDLQHWLRGEPIRARPVGRVEKVWRWCRRHPAPTAAAGIVLATVALAFVLITRSRNDALQARDDAVHLADEKAGLALHNARLASEQKKQAEKYAQLAQEERELRQKVQRASTTAALRQGLYFCERGDVGRGLLQLAGSLDLAHQARAADLEQAGRTQMALWRSRVTPLKMLLPHEDEVLAVAFSPNGRHILTGGADRTARLWDTISGQPVGTPFRVPPRSERPPQTAVAAPRFSSQVQAKHAGELVALAFRPDGEAFAAATGDAFHRGRSQLVDVGDLIGRSRGLGALTARPGTIGPSLGMGHPGGLEKRSAPPLLWDRSTGKLLGPAAHGEPVWAVAFSPDGRRMVTGGGSYQKRDGLMGAGLDMGPTARPWDPLGGTRRGGWAQLWDARTGQPLPLSLLHDNAVLAVAYSPDGQRILTGSADQTARLWDAQTGRPLGKPIPHNGPVLAVAFSPDGQTFLTCSQTAAMRGTVQLWSGSGAAVGTPLLHSAPVLAAVFSPDGRSVLTGGGSTSADRGDARLWDVATGKPIGQPLPHPGMVHAVAWSPDGRWILTGCGDRLARLWEAIPSPALVQNSQHDNVLAYSPDGRLVVVGTTARERTHCEQASLTETTGGGALRPLVKEPSGHVAFSPDGRTLVLAVRKERHGNISILHRVETISGKVSGHPIEVPDSLEALALSSDGRRLLTGSSKPYARHGEAILWDTDTGKRLHTFSFEEPVLCVAISPDGRMAASGSGMPGGSSGEARLYDVASGRLVKALPHGGPVRVVLFSPDGQSLATGGDDRTARVWAASTGEPRGPVLSHNGAVRALAFSPDGSLLLSGSDDQTARLWEAATGKARGDVLTHRGAVRAVAIRGEGNLLATGSDDQTAQVWEAATGRPLGEPLPHSGPVISVAFGSVDTVITRAARTNSVTRRRVGDAWEISYGLGWDCIGRAWTLPAPVEGDASTVLCWAEVLTGLALDDNGQPRPLEAGTWQERRRRLGGRADLAPAAEAIRAWHRREARTAEAAGQWFAAAWHLERLGKSEPASEMIQARLGKAHVLTGRWSEALRELRAALEQEPAAGELRYFRGLAHEGLHHDDEAIADFTGAIANIKARGQERDAWIVWFHRARAYFHQGEMDKAIADLSTVLNVKPDHGPSWHGRATAYAGQGKLDRAAADFLAALQRPDAPATTACDLAMARLGLGDRDGYRQACARALERLERVEDPGLIATSVWTACLAPGAVSDPQQLVRLLGRTYLENRNNYITQRAWAAALYRSDKPEEAIRAATSALQMRKEPTPSVWLLLALAHERRKQPREAGEWLDRAAEWIDRARKTKSDTPEQPAAVSWDRLPWNERLALEVLQKEAEAGRKEKPKE